MDATIEWLDYNRYVVKIGSVQLVHDLGNKGWYTTAELLALIDRDIQRLEAHQKGREYVKE